MSLTQSLGSVLQIAETLELLVLLIPLLISLITLAGMWTTFVKAGKPGWAAIIPFYNIWVLIKITDNEWWWFVLFLIPLAQIVAVIKISLDLAKQFGQGIVFGIGLWLFPFIFWPLLGFGDYRFQGSRF